MKRGWYIVVIGLLLSCQKSKFKKELAGVWEMEKSVGWVSTTYPPGAYTLTIKKDGTFERRRHDTVTVKGRYHIKKKKDCHPRESDMMFFTYETGSSYIEFDNDRMTLSTPNCYSDGGTVYYKRIK